MAWDSGPYKRKEEPSGSKTVTGTDVPDVSGPSAEQKEESEWQAALPANRRGIGGAAWRSSAEGKAHRAAWKAKRMTPPPSPAPPKLSDIEKK